MNNIERQRLEYRPDLKLNKTILSYYQANGINNVIDIDEDKFVTKELSEAVTEFSKYNIGSILEYGENTVKNIDILMKKIERHLLTKDDYKDLINITNELELDNYKELFDEETGNTYAELYPFINSLYDSTKNLVDFIKNDIIVEENYINEIKDLAEKHIRMIQDLEYSNLNDNINYKEIAINTQLYALLQNRFEAINELFNNIFNDIINSTSKDKLNNLDLILLRSLYHDIISIVEKEKIQMKLLDTDNGLFDLLHDVMSKKQAILYNRGLLENADEDTFYNTIDVVKNIETGFDNTILDLYKINNLDIINKNNYIDKIKQKHIIKLSIQLKTDKI